MTIQLGTIPENLRVHLAADADFVASMTSTTGTWPGTGVTLELIDPMGTVVASWPATISGAVASWDVDAAEVAPVVAAGVRTARLHYTDSAGSDLLWARGSVTVA